MENFGLGALLRVKPKALNMAAADSGYFHGNAVRRAGNKLTDFEKHDEHLNGCTGGLAERSRWCRTNYEPDSLQAWNQAMVASRLHSAV
jgi:hypothetical protein